MVHIHVFVKNRVSLVLRRGESFIPEPKLAITAYTNIGAIGLLRIDGGLVLNYKTRIC